MPYRRYCVRYCIVVPFQLLYGASQSQEGANRCALFGGETLNPFPQFRIRLCLGSFVLVVWSTERVQRPFKDFVPLSEIGERMEQVGRQQRLKGTVRKE